MSLSCDCSYDIDFDWYYGDASDYHELDTTTRKRCKSCNDLIDIKALCISFERWRPPRGDIEIRIYGEDGEVPLATHYMCEECADLYFSLLELGYCVPINEPMKDLVAEHNSMQHEEKTRKQ